MHVLERMLIYSKVFISSTTSCMELGLVLLNFSILKASGFLLIFKVKEIKEMLFLMVAPITDSFCHVHHLFIGQRTPRHAHCNY